MKQIMHIKELAEFMKKKYPGLEWKINQFMARRKNLYSIKGEVENILVSDRKDMRLTIYVKQKKGKKMMVGEAEIPIINATEDSLKKSIKDAKVFAALAMNPYFPLSKKEATRTILPDKKIMMIVDDKRGDAELMRFHDMIARVAGEAECTVNSHEIHATIEDIKVMNSQGQNAKQTRTSISLESVFSMKKGSIEREFIVEESAGSLDKFKLYSYIKDQIALTKDVLDSGKAPEYQGPIIVSGSALGGIMYPHLIVCPYVVPASSRVTYLGLSKYKKGKQVAGNPKGDLLTIATNPFIPGNVASSAFDEDGTPSKRVIIVKNNTFREYFGNQKYSHYIDEKPTGSMGAVEIFPGNTPTSRLKKGDHIEIVCFASFVPNELTGDFSAEIRLGYHVKNGKKTPFRGGLFTGNLFKLAENCKLSSNQMEKAGYLGPEAIRFEEGTIAKV